MEGRSKTQSQPSATDDHWHLRPTLHSLISKHACLAFLSFVIPYTNLRPAWPTLSHHLRRYSYVQLFSLCHPTLRYSMPSFKEPMANSASKSTNVSTLLTSCVRIGAWMRLMSQRSSVTWTDFGFMVGKIYWEMLMERCNCELASSKAGWDHFERR